MTSAVCYSTSTELALTVRMADALSVPDGGFSVDPRTGGDVAQGFAVAVYADRERQIMGRVTRDDITSYVFGNADLLAGNGLVVGGWRDPSSGIAYLDISRVVESRELAVALAKAHGQVAYFDFRSARSVSV